MSKIQFNRQPYTVSYLKDGVKQTIRRIPPPKIHDIWPEDKVELKVGKNDDFEKGDQFQVKHISVRQPNVLQLVNGDGQATFIDAYDVELIDEGSYRSDLPAKEQPRNNRYLLWP
jgi:hypothetical protein